MAKTYNISPTYGDTERDGVNEQVANAGPSTPIKHYKGMGYQKHQGAAGIGKVRPKPGVKVTDIYPKA